MRANKLAKTCFIILAAVAVCRAQAADDAMTNETLDGAWNETADEDYYDDDSGEPSTECSMNGYTECGRLHVPENITDLQNMENPDCESLEIIALNFMNCVAALPHCCEWMMEGSEDSEPSEEEAAFNKKCPSVKENFNLCETMAKSETPKPTTKTPSDSSSSSSFSRAPFWGLQHTASAFVASAYMLALRW
jgi:hypothetical protein